MNSENTLGFYVDSGLLDGIMNQTVRKYEIDIDEDTFPQLLETTEDGNIIIMSDEVPDDSLGCYFYNQGEFPFMIRRWLSHLLFSDGERQVATRIKYTKTTVSKRITFAQGDEAVEDENGECCVWKIIFGIETLSN